MATRPEGRSGKGGAALRLTLGVAWAALLATPMVRVAGQSADDTSQAFRDKLARLGIPVGSVVAVTHTKRYVLVDTHVNPSAGVLYVLSDRGDRVVAELPGWVLRVLPNGVVVYYRNEVHFAPTHSAEVWTWDPVTHRDARLYPNEPYDSVRRAYVDSVRSIYARVDEGWFRAANHHKDPTRFDSSVGDTIMVADSGKTVVFAMRFGGGEGTPAETPRLDVMVTCRGVGTKRQRCTEARR